MMPPLLRLAADNRGRGAYRADTAANTLYLYDVIGEDWFGGVSASQFARDLATIPGDVLLRINSPGGDVFEARAIIQALREHPGQITVRIDGVAASAASVIAMAGHRIEIADGAMMMIHNAWTATMGNALDHLEQAALLERVDQALAADYAARAGLYADQVAAWMAAETWFTATEAIDAGFADALAPAGKAAVEARAHWQLAAYRNAPPPPTQAPAPPPDPRLAAARRRLALLERTAA